jgi:transcriptional regulator with XRE-family HTH domain
MTRKRSTRPKVAPLDRVLVDNLDRLRAAGAWSQEDLARRMRELGQAWTRETLARIKRGSRQISLGESLALAHVFGVDLGELVSAQTAIEILPGVVAYDVGAFVRAGGRLRCVAESPDAPPDEAELAIRHAADRLGVAADTVAETARARWGRSFAEERDRRVRQHLEDRYETREAPARTFRALRGRVSLGMYRELQEDLGTD